MNNLTDSKWPKISIVTPNYNMDQYLEATISSVVDQGYPNLEYIIIDGGSTDESLEIIQKYQENFAYWISEPDKGLYHALQKGFDKSTGEIMGWINSDDMLHPNSLFAVAAIFKDLPEVEWIQGVPTVFDEQGRTVHISKLRPWSKFQYYLKDFKWIQQESIFWKKSLWEKSGSRLEIKLKYAGDLELWTRFFRHTHLFCVDTLIGGFRVRKSEQLSSNINAYFSEAEEVLNEELKILDDKTLQRLDKIKRNSRVYQLILKLRFFNRAAFEQRFIHTLYKFPPIIHYDHHSEQFKLGKN